MRSPAPRRDRRSAGSEVLVRNVAEPQGTWSPDQAVDLLRQGYSVDRAAAVTGYDQRWLAAQTGRLTSD